MSDETIRQALAAHAAGTGRPLQQELSQGIYNSGGAPQRQSPPRSSRQNSFQPQQGSRQNSFQPQQGSRQNSFQQQQQAPRQNSFGQQHTPPRDTYIDENGDHVRTYTGEGQPPVRVHNYDPAWIALDAAAPKQNSGAVGSQNPNITAYTNENGDRVWESTGPVPMRCHTPPATDGRASPPVYSTRNKEGDYVQQYAGDSGDLPVRAHYNWDEPQKNHY